MSRIGNKVVTLPEGVTVTNNNGIVTVTGPKGTLTVKLNEGITMNVDGNNVHFTRKDDEKQTKQNHGTTRANFHNAVVGVKEGYKVELTMIGIGYKAQMRGADIEIWGGYSHTVKISPFNGVKISCPDATNIVVEGIDKQAVGEVAARIRAVRPPEPYLGKGIRYKNEYVATKEGKRAAAKK